MPRTPPRSQLVVVASPAWLAALDRLVAASGADGRGQAVEWALDAWAAHYDLTLPPRGRPLGWNQYDLDPEDAP